MFCKGKLASSFQPLDLSEKEINQLIDFLENALYDSEMARYVPESVLSGNCFPNNDAISKQQLGCD
ncbi:MAG: cytochrome c peroxidase [Saprospiraceae bacterium]|jgi:cytochrome c peroxidase